MAALITQGELKQNTVLVEIVLNIGSIERLCRQQAGMLRVCSAQLGFGQYEFILN